MMESWWVGLTTDGSTAGCWTDEKTTGQSWWDRTTMAHCWMDEKTTAHCWTAHCWMAHCWKDEKTTGQS